MLQKHYQIEKQHTKGNGSHFFLPQVLVLIFKFLSGCNDASARMKILRDLTDLLDSNPSNIEALMVLLNHAYNLISSFNLPFHPPYLSVYLCRNMDGMRG